jgi:hypothetical protein
METIKGTSKNLGFNVGAHLRVRLLVVPNSIIYNRIHRHTGRTRRSKLDPHFFAEITRDFAYNRPIGLERTHNNYSESSTLPALAADLSVHHYIPHARIAEIFRDLLHLPVSTGTVDKTILAGKPFRMATC